MPADPTPDLPSSVFVYGTLMPDERYSGVASAAGAPERAERATLPGFVLHHLSPEGYPAVTPGAGTVHGWVLHYAPGTWAAALAHLDDLEGLHLRRHCTGAFRPRPSRTPGRAARGCTCTPERRASRRPALSRCRPDAGRTSRTGTLPPPGPATRRRRDAARVNMNGLAIPP